MSMSSHGRGHTRVLNCPGLPICTFELEIWIGMTRNRGNYVRGWFVGDLGNLLLVLGKFLKFPYCQLANKEVSSSFWYNPKITVKQQMIVTIPHRDSLHESMPSGFNRFPNPTMSGMHTDRHHVGLYLCVEALGKGKFGSSLIGMDACRNERLLDQGIQVPENISRAILGWVFPNDTGPSARHQSRPNAIFVRSNPLGGRQAHLDPSKIPPQDRDIHLVELKFCPDGRSRSVCLDRQAKLHMGHVNPGYGALVITTRTHAAANEARARNGEI
eukprot:1156315-Pelagomonas_calceolata.AAC.1